MASQCLAQDMSLTYAELDKRANQLAHRLISLGVGPEVPVGVLMDRSLDLAVALLGIMRAGGAYVPMDPSYPSDRLALMVEDSEVCWHANAQCMAYAWRPTNSYYSLVAVQAPVLLSQEKVHARVAMPTKAHVLLVSLQIFQEVLP